MKWKILISIGFIIALYFFSYIWIRQTRAETWENDGKEYVIFPADKVYLYYFYRPLSYVDGISTGMRFHIGQHK